MTKSEFKDMVANLRLYGQNEGFFSACVEMKTRIYGNANEKGMKFATDGFDLYKKIMNVIDQLDFSKVK